MSEKEDAKLIAERILNKSNAAEDKGKVKNARIVLLVIGVINILVGLYYLFGVGAEVEGYTGLILGGLFVGLYFIGIQRPMLALIAGLSIYGILILLDAIVDPVTIIKGIVLKVIFIILLIKGIISINKLPKEKKEQDSELLDDI